MKEEKTTQLPRSAAGFPLVQVFKLGEESPLFEIQASYSGEEKQNQSPAGVGVQIEIYNPTDEIIEIRNIFDRLRVSIKGQDGQLFYTPGYISRSQKLMRNKATRFDTDDRKLVTPYKIVSVFANDKKLEEADIEAFIFKLQPKTKLRAEILIEKVVLGKYIAAGEKNAEGVPVLPGIFAVEISLFLNSLDLKRQALYREDRRINKKLIIHYGVVPPNRATTTATE